MSLNKLFRVTLPFLFFVTSGLSLANTELPLDYFIKHGDYLELKLSPDGKHMAGRVRQDGAVFLYIVDSKTMEVVGGVKPRKKTEIHSITWASNDRVVFEFAEKFSGLDRAIPTGELYATNIDGTKTELLYGFRAGDEKTGRRLHTKKDIRASQEVISILEDDPKHILIAEYPWANKPIPTISKLNIYSGQKTKVERIPYPNADILADKKGNVRFISWYDQNSDIHAASRKSNNDEWQEMKITKGASEVGKPVQISNDGTKVYLRVNLGEKQISSLQELNLIDGSIKTLFAPKSADLSFWESDLITNEPVVGVSYPDAGEFEYTETENSIKTIHKQLAKAFKGQDFLLLVTLKMAQNF